jgi:hypothetical protein
VTFEISEEDLKVIRQFVMQLINQDRHGELVDQPEGVRWVMISDTLANLFAARCMKVFGWKLRDGRVVKNG